MIWVKHDTMLKIRIHDTVLLPEVNVSVYSIRPRHTIEYGIDSGNYYWLCSLVNETVTPLLYWGGRREWSGDNGTGIFQLFATEVQSQL